MSLWCCHDRLSGEQFEVHGGCEDDLATAVEKYISEGIDSDTGPVEYAVTCTAVDGSEYAFRGTVAPTPAPED